jgi:hypothetical protein
MKMYWGSGGIASRTPNLGTRWRFVVSYTPRPLYPLRKSPWYQLNRGLSGSQSRSGRGGEENMSRRCPFRELNPGRPACSLVSILSRDVVMSLVSWGGKRLLQSSYFSVFLVSDYIKTMKWELISLVQRTCHRVFTETVTLEIPFQSTKILSFVFEIIFWLEILKERDHSENPDVDGRVILE